MTPTEARALADTLPNLPHYQKAESALRALADQVEALQNALQVADEHLTLLYPTGVESGDFVCVTVRSAREAT